MLVARYAPRVEERSGAGFHLECYEAWYFGRYGRRPSLEATPESPHVFRVKP